MKRKERRKGKRGKERKREREPADTKSKDITHNFKRMNIGTENVYAFVVTIFQTHKKKFPIWHGSPLNKLLLQV